MGYKIEPGFNDMKNTMGCFSYHFWTSALQKRKRWKNPDAQSIDPGEDKKVKVTKKAMASFVCLGTIATGILTVVSFTCPKEIWNRYPGWIRTLRSKIPSVATTKVVIAYDFPHVLSVSSRFMGFNFINSWLRKDNFIYDNIPFHDSDSISA